MLSAFPLTAKLRKLKLWMKNTPDRITPISLNHKKVEEVFWAIRQRHISQNCEGNTFFAFTGHMICLSVGNGSPGHDVAGAARGLIPSRSSPKVERVILKFRSREIADIHYPAIPHTHSHSHVRGAFLSSTAPVTRPRCLWLAGMTASCSCCDGNKAAKMWTIHRCASGNDLTQEEKICFSLHNITQWKGGYFVTVFHFVFCELNSATVPPVHASAWLMSRRNPAKQIPPSAASRCAALLCVRGLFCFQSDEKPPATN